MSEHQTHRCTRCGVLTCSCRPTVRPDICDPCTTELTRRTA